MIRTAVTWMIIFANNMSHKWHVKHSQNSVIKNRPKGLKQTLYQKDI